MLTDKELEKISLFYYFAFLEEKKAQQAAIKTVRQMQVLRTLSEDTESRNASLIKITLDIFTKEKIRQKSGIVGLTSEFLNLPPNSNWGPWFEFKKASNEREFLTVIYSQILGFSDQSIARGLDLPMGTVRYRTGRGLKLLGSIHGPVANV